MKGISAVLATVLIVVITVAIIGMAYGWATGMFEMVGTTSQDATQQQIGNIEKAVSIIAATCVSGNSITGNVVGGGNDINPPQTNTIIFTIKNIGTANIVASELIVFFNNNLQENIITSDLVKGASAEYRILVYSEGLINIKVSAPAGNVEEDVTCPNFV